MYSKLSLTSLEAELDPFFRDTTGHLPSNISLIDSASNSPSQIVRYLPPDLLATCPNSPAPLLVPMI